MITLPRYRSIIKKIIERGFEVGIHLSYNAHKNKKTIAAEKKRLENITGHPVRGNRHHYWKMKKPFWDTLAGHAESGLFYDTSIGFNDHEGFRLGVALPFYPWNPLRTREIKTLQLPTVLMDGNIFYHELPNPAMLIEKFQPLLETLKLYQGTACLCWHVRTSFPGSKEFKAWGEGYLALLRYLAKDPEIILCNGSKAHAMASARWALCNRN